jgi:hypothetical protein
VGEELAERTYRARVAEQRAQELVRVGLRQGVDPELGEAGPVRPPVLVVGPIVDEQQEARAPHPLEERVEQGLCFGIDPLEVFEQQHEGLALALSHDQAHQRFEHVLAPLVGIERAERIVRRQRVEERQDRRDRVGEPGIEVAERRRHALGHARRGIARVDLKIGAEHLDDGQVGRGPLVGERPAVEDPPRLRLRRPEEFVDEPRLADAGLGADGGNLALAQARELEQVVQVIELRRAPHEARELLGVGIPGLGPRRRAADERRDLDGLVEALHRAGPERHDLDGAAGEAERAGRGEDGAGVRHLLHARRQVRRLTDRRVVHVQIAADRAHDDLA